MERKRIYADFHNLDDENRLRLTCQGTREDLARLGLELTPGMKFTFYTDDADERGQSDDLLVDGVAQFSEEEKCWVGEVDWNTLRHASEVKV